MKVLAKIMLITVLMLPVFVKAQLQIDDSLVVYFSFDAGEGDIAQDHSEYENNGTIKGGIEWVDGQHGKALKFDGTTGFIEIPHADSLNIESAFTVENWGYPIDIVREQVVAEKGFWAGSWLSHIKTVRGYVFAIAASGWSPIWLATSADSAFEAEKWYHMAMTWDGTSRKLYINGQLDGEDGPGGADLPENTQSLYIAGGRGNYYYDGIFDEIRIWNRALSGEELEASMDMGAEQVKTVEPSGKLPITWGTIKCPLK